MKKKFVAVLMCVCLAFSVTACGGGDKTKAVEEYFESEAMQTMLDSQLSAMETSGMSIDVSAEGNNLIYEYTFDEGTLDESSLDLVKEALVSGLEQQASVFEGIAAEMNSTLGIEDCKVIIRYYYGTEVLAESTFE